MSLGNTLNNLKGKVGNIVDKTGTAFRLPEFGLSEKIAGNKQTTFTGITPQSQEAGFVRNYQNNSALNVNNPKYGPVNNPNPENKSTGNSGGNTGSGGGGSARNTGSFGGGSAQSAQDAQQEKTNNDFRNQLGNSYNDLRSKFGSAITDVDGLLRDLPGQLKQLNIDYKNAIGNKQTAELGQVGTQREGVQQDQKRGIMGIKENVAKSMRELSNRLANVGAGSSSAKGFFARAIQDAGSEQTKKVVEQAANNYALLDDQENKIKSNFQTLIDELDREEQSNLANINKDIPAIKASVDEALRQSGEYETLDKNGLTDAYLARLVPLYEQAKQSTESYRKQLDNWRVENQNKIGALRNQIIQDFTPKQITYDKLNVIQPDQTIGKEQDLTQPNALLERARRLREQGIE